MRIQNRRAKRISIRRRAGSDLREYQQKAVVELERLRDRSVLLVLPTAGGKTVIVAEVIRREVQRGGKVLFLAHRRELIQQCCTRLREAGVGDGLIGVIMSDAELNIDRPIQVASVQTLVRRKKILKDLCPTLLIVDEAHRAVARSYKSALALTKWVIGITATPQRLDGSGLGNIFSKMLVGPSGVELAKKKFIAQPRMFTSPDRPSLDRKLKDVNSSGNDFDRRQLSKLVNTSVLSGNIVREWERRAKNRQTVVFAVSVAHARTIADRFMKSGVVAECVHGKMSPSERSDALARFESATTRVLVNCELLIEGWDMPSARCAVLARPTRSQALYMQQCGRVMRPGEVRPIILDHAGSARWFGIPNYYKPPVLHQKTNGNKTQRIAARLCACGGVSPIGSLRCVECEEKLPKRERVEPSEDRRSLVEVIREAVAEAKSAGKVIGGEFGEGLTPKIVAMVRQRLSLGWTMEESVVAPKRDLIWKRWKRIATSNGITRETFDHRRNGKHWDEKRAATQRQASGPEGRMRPVTIGGKTYSSVANAAKRLRVSTTTIHMREAREAGRCITCRKSKPADGKNSCAKCLSKAGATRRNAIRLGLCSKCQKRKQQNGKNTCTKCVSAERSARCSKSVKEILSGICNRCHKNRSRKGLKSCAACAKIASEYKYGR